MASPFRLVVRAGPNPGTAFDLTKEVTVLGRDVSNDIVVGDTEISRQHSRMTHTPGGYVLEDLGSTNGTFVNGERLVSPRVLNPGDLIGLGENVTMVFEGTTPEAAATVMGPAARGAGPPPGRQPFMPPPPEPEAAHPPPSEAPKVSRRTWILAGCGCLAIVAVCVLVLLFMPCEWYVPITSIFGYSYCPP